MTDLHLSDERDTIKMIRETLAVARYEINRALSDTSGRWMTLTTREAGVAYAARLQRLIDECDRQRPLGPDGKHGNLHTETCGCAYDVKIVGREGWRCLDGGCPIQVFDLLWDNAYINVHYDLENGIVECPGCGHEASEPL